MKSVSFNRNTSKGFSLIELLLVLGVLAILLVAAFVVYPQVRDRNQANTEVSNLTSIKANITNLYASKGGNYSGGTGGTPLSTGIANQARAFPASMNGGVFESGTTINSSWGGTVNVAANTAAVTSPAGTFTAGRTFSVTYTAVPAGVCLPLVSGAAGNFASITIGGEEVINATSGFDPAAAAAQCTGTPTIVFTSN